MLQGSQANKTVKTAKKLVKKLFRASYIACAAAWGTYPPGISIAEAEAIVSGISAR